MNASKPTLLTSLALSGCCASACAAAEVDFRSAYYATGLSRTNPAIASLSVDGLGQGRLGQGRLGQNAVFIESQPAQPWQIQKLRPKRLACRPANADSQTPPAWEFEFGRKSFLIRSRYAEGLPAQPLVLTFDQPALNWSA